MRYAVAIEIGDEKTAYGVVVPDLPGVFSAGDTLEEALANVEEAILLALEDLLERGEKIPAPTELAQLMVGTRDGRGSYKKFPSKTWGWFVVNIDTSKLTAKAVRVNITLPDGLLSTIDKYVGEHPGETRSGFLARGAQALLNR